MKDNNFILDWPCKVCGIANRYHEVFKDPTLGNDSWSRQFQLYDAPKLVSSFDHYADPPKTNIEYLEYKYEQRNFTK